MHPSSLPLPSQIIWAKCRGLLLVIETNKLIDQFHADVIFRPCSARKFNIRTDTLFAQLFSSLTSLNHKQVMKSFENLSEMKVFTHVLVTLDTPISRE